MKAKKKDYKLLILAATRALRLHIGFCRSRSLKCLDPPLLAPRLLQRLGIWGYEARRLWREAREAAKEEASSLVLYHWGSTLWRLEPVFELGEVFYDPVTLMPMDPDDCRLVSSCAKAPRAGTFKVYVSGIHGDEVVKLNIVYISLLVEEATGGLASEALQAFEQMLAHEAGGYYTLERFVEEVIAKGCGLLRLFLPRPPCSISELLRYSPASRMLFNLFSGRRASH